MLPACPWFAIGSDRLQDVEPGGEIRLRRQRVLERELESETALIVWAEPEGRTTHPRGTRKLLVLKTVRRRLLADGDELELAPMARREVV
jgi:hypothetical protein